MVWLQTEETFTHFTQEEEPTPTPGGDSNITIDNQPISTHQEIEVSESEELKSAQSLSGSSYTQTYYDIVNNNTEEPYELILNWISCQAGATSTPSFSVELCITSVVEQTRIKYTPGIFISCCNTVQYLKQRVTIPPGRRLSCLKYGSANFALSYSLISNHN